MAGPTDGQTADLTYLPWRLSASALERRFGIRHVGLANDFAAAAHGLPLVAPQHVVPLQAGQPLARAPRVILGAGTGLGVAGMVWNGERSQVIPGEGGHMGFSPQTPEQLKLAEALLAQTGRVSVEDMVSGPGLVRIHRFLGGRADSPAGVGAAALDCSDPLARRALDLWLEAYGAFAGDLALQWLARGGVYLAGGMAAKLLPDGAGAAPFVAAFNAKREHRPLAEAMPIHLVTEERLGLLGALALAAARLQTG
ncbi:MAG: glucokinase [Zoogloea sp.]|nr:glucokinase [Zoogloea sp.]